ncbi:MAG: LPS-assembly protein LptD [Campylobacterales bacterium]|nr:LPS-assembly protein LptD [Campylobacterales bacterium]
MRKIILSASLSTLLLCAQNEKMQLLSTDVNATQDVVEAKNGVIVHYEDALFGSDRALFDKSTNILKLYGDIESVGYRGSKAYSQQVTIDTNSENSTFDTLFLITKSDIWLYANNATKEKNIYKIGNSVFSSCALNCPLWRMSFDSSDYDDKDEYMKLYGAKLYMWDVPVFYFPYIAFSTNNDRRSGLLFPYFGYSNNEGLFYEQPIFWAIAPNMDLEFNPQIRTARGFGGYSTFRFVDSQYSSGQIRASYFGDFKSYQEDNFLENRDHYSIEFIYNSSNFLKRWLDLKYEEGLYANITYVNDIDAINLQRNTLTHFGLTPLQESRVNYFLYDDDYYAGLNAKYFIDTRETSNSSTLQILPSLQLHKYLKPIIFNNLTYNADFSFTNLYRKEGIWSKRSELSIPFEYSFSLLDDYLRVSLKEDLYYTKLFFKEYEDGKSNFEYFSTVHNIKFYSDLVKPYGNFVHVIHPSISYILPGSETQHPINFDDLTEEKRKLFSVGLPEENIELDFAQYFYNKEMKLKFFHRFSQNFYADRTSSKGEISNEMGYYGNDWSLYQDISYNYDIGKVTSMAHRATWNGDKYLFSLSHTYKKEFYDDDIEVAIANSINTNLRYDFTPRWSGYAGVSYNFDEGQSTQWRFGAKYEKDCFGFSAGIAQNTTPVLKSSGASYIDSTTFYFQFNFKPFATVGTGDLFQ